jgi:hypothetical protein
MLRDSPVEEYEFAQDSHPRETRRLPMKKILPVIMLLSLTVCSTAFGQEKGVDRQNERIRDGGTNRVPATTAPIKLQAPGAASISEKDEPSRRRLSLTPIASLSARCCSARG